LEPSPLRLRISNFFFNWTLMVIIFTQHSLWREDGFLVYNCCWPSWAQSFSCPSPAGLMTTFYCMRFETPSTWRARSSYIPQEQGGPVILQPLDSLFVASYDSQGLGRCIRTRLHKGYWTQFLLRPTRTTAENAISNSSSIIVCWFVAVETLFATVTQ
jgi:hypothetical protein